MLFGNCLSFERHIRDFVLIFSICLTLVAAIERRIWRFPCHTRFNMGMGEGGCFEYEYKYLETACSKQTILSSTIMEAMVSFHDWYCYIYIGEEMAIPELFDRRCTRAVITYTRSYLQVLSTHEKPACSETTKLIKMEGTKVMKPRITRKNTRKHRKTEMFRGFLGQNFPGWKTFWPTFPGFFDLVSCIARKTPGKVAREFSNPNTLSNLFSSCIIQSSGKITPNSTFSQISKWNDDCSRCKYTSQHPILSSLTLFFWFPLRINAIQYTFRMKFCWNIKNF